jgi:hypothetical protein
MAQISQDDLYLTLGVSPQATAEEIDVAYKEAIRRVHPDVSSISGVPVTAGEKEFRTHLAARINAAATILRSPTKRAIYDLDRRDVEQKAARRATSSTPTASKPRYTNPVYRTPPKQARPETGYRNASQPPEPPTPGEAKWATPAAGAAYRTPEASFDPYASSAAARRAAAAGPPRSLSDWFLHRRVGQWLLVAVVLIIGWLAAPLIDPSEAIIFSLRVTLVFMVAFALAQRSLSNPFGDVFLAVMRMIDEVLNHTGDATMGKRS